MDSVQITAFCLCSFFTSVTALFLSVRSLRKLATIQTITALEPIKNADSIELARILGWAVVVKRGEHQVGDKVIYCEIDSLLPERPEFEFLRNSCFKSAQIDAEGNVAVPAGFPLSDGQDAGSIFTGICFPVSMVRDGDSLPVGAEVTADLGIVKWEPPFQPEWLAGSKVRSLTSCQDG